MCCAYVCCAYVQPEGRQYYQFYDCDLYDILENELELFAGLGNVCLIGDLNSWTGLLSDNNENDNIHQIY